MPADRCPSCGTVGPAGSCACHAFSPAEQTAVLPPLDGPHLVRPYVADTPVMEPGYPTADPFGTQAGPPPVQPITAQAGPPPVQPITTQTVPFVPPQPSVPGAVPPPPPGRAPHVPQAASPFAPPPVALPLPAQPDAAATQLLPPVQAQGSPGQPAPFQLGRVVPPPPQPEPPTALIPPVPTDPGAAATALIPPIPAGPEPATALLPPVPDGPERPAADLGMFSFHDDDPAAPVSRTERRSQRRRSADRKRLVIAGGAVGVTALGASLAMLLSSSPNSVDHALPAPTGPTVASSSASSTPSASPSGEASSEASASPSPTRTSARPSQTVTTKPAAAPASTAPAEPTSAPPTTQPPSSAPSRTLRRDDTGPDVVQLQGLLAKVNCLSSDWLSRDRTGTGQPGFGSWTESALAVFQQQNRSKLKNIDRGVYDPQTRAVLEAAAQNPNC